MSWCAMTFQTTMPCHSMPCHGIHRDVIPCHVDILSGLGASCHTMPCHMFFTCSFTVSHLVGMYRKLFHMLPYPNISYHVVSCPIISYKNIRVRAHQTIPKEHIVSHRKRIVSCHIVSSHNIACHVISYEIKKNTRILICRMTSHHVISYRVIKHHILTYHVDIHISESRIFV